MRVVPYYDEQSGSLSVVWGNDPHRAVVVSESVTLLCSTRTGEAIGVQIENVSKIIEEAQTCLT